MARQLVECVPNFSEGRDTAKIDAIVQAILSVPEVVLLDRESDADHNRSVLTFVGPPAAVADAAFRSVEKAVELIDLTRHQGAHPRIGAADVVPFIPIEGVTLEECVRLAERVAAEIWSKLRVPVYFYEVGRAPAGPRQSGKYPPRTVRGRAPGDGHGGRARIPIAAMPSAIPLPEPPSSARANSSSRTTSISAPATSASRRRSPGPSAFRMAGSAS